MQIALHPRRSVPTPLQRSLLLLLARIFTDPTESLPFPTGLRSLCSTLLLFRCTEASAKSQQKSRLPRGTSGTELCGNWRELRSSSGASLAPRCCPFPVSSTVAVVNAPLAQRITDYTSSPANKQTRQEPRVWHVVNAGATPAESSLQVSAD